MFHARFLAPALAGVLIVWSMHCPASTLQEDFSTDPTTRGWKTLGDTNLFAWDSVGRTLKVIWDSSHTNSYFFHSLGTVVTEGDDFSLAFDLQLSSFAAGVDHLKPN